MVLLVTIMFKINYINFSITKLAFLVALHHFYIENHVTS